MGVGASAGGLAAFSELLRGLPPHPGFPVVYVQHLSPSHGSALPELFGAVTKLPVVAAADKMPLEPDHVYVLPPNTEMTVEDGTLRVGPRPEGPTKHTPIDVLFRSLAQAVGDQALAVLLSGSSQDGVSGLRDIKVAGGTVVVQSPDSAEFDIMPRGAISAGLADLVVSPDSMGATLVRLAQSPFLGRNKSSAADELSFQAHHLKRVFNLLRNATGVDFSHYKEPTIRRRLLRRMLLNKRNDIEQYLTQLEEQPAEVQTLYHDLLIQVTRFFREPESFQTLREKVFPVILKERQPEQPIRIWVPGCASGEEAYSVAIELLEYLGDNANAVQVQVFATDVSDRAVDKARVGRFPESIADDVSPQRLRRFFVKSDGTYQIAKAVRDLCVFARQDLTRDPPFSKLDLIVCRNVLIYLDPFVHRKLMTIFHYSLKPDRFLMLGRAESTGAQGDLFHLVDKKFRIYRRKPSVARMDLDYHPHEQAKTPPGRGKPDALRGEPGGVQGEAMRLLLNRFAPPAVIVDSDLRIVHARGQTGTYLELAPGDASLNLLKMTREGLLFGLRAAINEAKKSGAAVRKSGLRVKTEGRIHNVSVEVSPLTASNASNRHYLVLFEPGSTEAVEPEAPSLKRPRAGARGKKVPATESELRAGQLQQELAASREYLQSIIQDLEATNEELQSANEEILSSNEELQSTNEELDTAKEELQSTNEEINTVNEELQARNEELSRANSDLLNLLAGVQIAIVFLTSDLRIRRFTPMAEKLLNLIPTDIGRPIGNIRPNIDCPDLEKLITEVVDTVTAKEREVQDRDGRWLLLRIRPYKSVENRIEGAVLVLLDIDAIRRQEERLRTAQDYSVSLLEMVDQPMAILDSALHVQSANAAFVEAFADEREIAGKSLAAVGNGRLDVPALARLVEETLRAEGAQTKELVSAFPGLGGRRLRVAAQRFLGADGQSPSVVMVVRGTSGDGV